MPFTPARPCKAPRCPELTRLPHGYCARHAGHAPQRPSKPSKLHTSGNYAEWRKVRQEVLDAAGILRSEQHLYSVDHRPAYNPSVEPDHRKYELVPMLTAAHNAKTAREDGGFGNARRAEA